MRSIRAGNDIVLTTGQGSWIRVYRALLRRGARVALLPRPRGGVGGARDWRSKTPSTRTFVRA